MGLEVVQDDIKTGGTVEPEDKGNETVGAPVEDDASKSRLHANLTDRTERPRNS